MTQTSRLFTRIAFLGMSIPAISVAQVPTPAPINVSAPKFQSPSVAALGKFGDTPITYHTGVPEISIPIFTIQEGNLNVPITLSYHSSGIRVDETASWVGLGWSLSAGGSLSRTVMGGPDEGRSTSVTYNDSYQSGCGITGWYKNYGFPSCLGLSTNGCGSTNPNNGKPAGNNSFSGLECWAKYMAAARGYTDTEPDLYSFNFPGGSGRFFFDSQRKTHMISESDYFIKPAPDQDMFNYWHIYSTDGTKYTFGVIENSYSGQNAFTPGDENKSSTTWYLTRIESANGQNWIQFEYEPEKSSYGTKASHTAIIGTFGNSGITGGAARGYTLTSTNGYRLSKITTKSGFTTVDFNESTVPREDLTSYTHGDNPNTEAKALDNIQITYGSRCKTFSFSYTYFISPQTAIAYAPDTNFDRKRLKLLSVRESTCDNTTILPPYLFFYNETDPMPRRYSFSQDHWGYYNGADNQTLLPGLPWVPTAAGGTADRSPNESKMKVGVLEKIIYPTGGATSFTYEAHRVSPSATEIIGGLRVKTVQDADGVGGIRTRTVNYLMANWYNGQISYTQNPSSNAYYVGQNQFDWGIIYSSAPNPPMQSTQGYHIGYSMVEVDFGGIGKSVYHYYNNPPNISTIYPKAPTVAVIGTGLPFKEEHYNASGTLLQSVQYSYSNTGGNFVMSARKLTTVTCFNKKPGNPQETLEDCQNETVMFTDYTLSTYRNNLTTKTEYNDGVAKITSYEYDTVAKINFPRSEQTTNSDGTVTRVEYTYPSTIGSGAPASMGDRSNSAFRNMLNALVEQKIFKNGVQTNRIINTYIEAGAAINVTSTKSYLTGGADFTENLYDYYPNANVKNITKSNGDQLSFIWGYKGLLPIAEVKYAVADKIFFCGFEEDVANLASWTHTGAKAHLGTYTVSLPSVGSYVLSYWQKTSAGAAWQFVEVPNVTTAQTIGAAGVAIDDVRLHPAGALMTTYNYEPGVGISSATDPNGVTSFYVYDKLGRLQLVKDDKGNILKSYTYNYKL